MLQFVRRCGEDRTPFAGLNLPGWMSALLRGRGISTEEQARRFLYPSLEDLHDPFAMADMEAAVRLIREALAAGDRILVYGDYDVDGVCASAILTETLRELGSRADFRIPLRGSEGYGLNEAAVRETADSGFRLLITVDCGITSVGEVALARQLGLKVIVTDHHEPPETLPAADAVLNPLLGGYPFRRLCGAGVALKVCQALLGRERILPRLELAALATVADVVPLIDENRVIVREGLLRMRQSGRPGIRALLEVSAIDGDVRSEDLAFRLGPRLNAAGRLEDASQGVRLLLTRDEAEARAIAAHLEENNRSRRQQEQEMLRQAKPQVLETNFREDRVILVSGKGWNPGLIGLAAGRLCEEYHFPVIALSLREDGTATGSCRSVPGVNIYRMLSLCGDLFIRFGGHEQAAGLTLPSDRLPELRSRLNEAIRENCPDSCFVPKAEYNVVLPFRDLNLDTLSHLEALEPTGFGNPAPVFLASGAHVQELRRVGRDRSHLKLSLADDSGILMDGIAFSMGDEEGRGYTRADVLYTPARNEFRGRVSVQLQVSAIRPSPGSLRLPSREALFLGLLQEIPLFPENETALPDRVPRADVLEALRQPLGTLVLTRCPETAAALAQEVGAGLETGAPEGPQGYSTVLCGWRSGELDDRWRTVILADGLPLAGEAALIRARCHSAELFCLDTPDSPPDPASLCPEDDALRDLYRLLRGRRFDALDELAGAAGLTWRQVLIGLQAFSDTHLADWTLSPFRVELRPAVRCSMSDSPLIRRLRGPA